MNLFQIAALHERGLGRVRVDAETVGLVLFARFAGVLIPRLFDFEFFFDRGLIDFFVVLLFGDKGAYLAFEIRADLLSELGVEPGLFVCLESERVDRVADFASGDVSVISAKGRGVWAG